MELIDQINDQFNRLGISTQQEPCSGLTAMSVDPESSNSIVSVFDDYVEGKYKTDCLLEILKDLKAGDVDLDSESYINIWNFIADCEV